MDFIDEVVVEVTAGKGGNGMASFRREKYVEFGGPSGGNGGNGGHVIFIGEEGENTLLKLKYNRHIKAEPGVNGSSKSMHGANATHKYVKVPLGTVVYTLDGRFIGEVLKHGEELIVAKGGRGGKGNQAFASQKDPAPAYAENGDMGEKLKVRLELKVLADVGLIGYPSVGKSTLISVISNAKPKIADYPFTTLVPNLGMVYVGEESFVVADLPGLIENAHLGQGLGIQFLRHIERCRVLVHLISMDSEDPYQDYLAINQELREYNEKIIERPQIVVTNKMDLEDAEQKYEALKEKLPNQVVLPISALTKQNLETLKYEILKTLHENPIVEPVKKEVVYQLEEEIVPFEINKDEEGVYVLSGEVAERLFYRTNFVNEDSVRRFSHQLKGIGVDEALRQMGAKNGDIVRILEYEFEFFD
ncbi:GTP-binding protein obg [Alteracholeplasma palmae J233]|uniref:GTPase Obg n=1 Tax=Alteracholeplasma palmae (strain ATCC 49389 / J233) TaxID=1318466 RepID=U4KKE9_ALTPJ|nr:GTPase ObgE [Alteracholeplasma palmae]CCV64072.1 GTP-binding protein obg [Alteracholeplasma palmae J233]